MGVNTSISSNSYSYKSGAAYYYYYNRNIGNSFYGLTLPMYESNTYYYLSNNGPGAGARTRRVAPRVTNTDKNNLSLCFF